MTLMIKKEDIEKLATLSRIDVSEEEKEGLVKDIESILSYISEIQEVSSKKSIPTIGDLRNVMRIDGEPHESEIYTKKILDEAPKKEKGYLKVKKILPQE